MAREACCTKVTEGTRLCVPGFSLPSFVNRDFPDWPEGVPASAKQLRADPDNPLRDKPDPADQVPDQKLANLISTFCTNLNCVVPFCSTHCELPQIFIYLLLTLISGSHTSATQ
jgi:hypothetical protein